MNENFELQLLEANFSRMPREKVIKFRVNDNEAETINELAQLLGTDVSSAMRYLAKVAKVVLIADEQNPREVKRTTVTFDPETIKAIRERH